MDVVDAIAALPTASKFGHDDVPLAPITILSATVVEVTPGRSCSTRSSPSSTWAASWPPWCYAFFSLARGNVPRFALILGLLAIYYVFVLHPAVKKESRVVGR